MTRILFVCVANICRSPIAESVARSIAKSEGIVEFFQFDSAGTIGNFAGQAPDDRARQVLTERGYVMSGIKARTITLKDFEKFDLILAMDRKILFSLQRICPPAHRNKLHLLLEYLANEADGEVPDPYYGNLAGFEHVLDICEQAVRPLLAKHTSMKPASEKSVDDQGILKRIKQLFSHRGSGIT